MRRVVLVVIAVWGLLIGPANWAWAGPTAAAAATDVCTINDKQLVGASGLVATDSGFTVVNRRDETGAIAMKIFTLDPTCKVTKSVTYASRDPQDVALAADGTIWVADIGDNPPDGGDRRAAVALWKLAPGASAPVINRVSYPGTPDGPHDAKAMVLSGDGTPVIVTYEPSGAAGLYTPSAALQRDIAAPGVKLKKVGDFTPEKAGTPGYLAIVGQNLITGGATSPDGKRVALRTYSAIYEWDVTGGDVVKAITTGAPRITALSDSSAQGEALAYTPDGKFFLTLSVPAGEAKIVKYSTVPPVASGPTAAAPTTAPQGDSGSWWKPQNLSQLTYLIAGVGVLGLVLVLVGVLGIRRSRRNRRANRSSATRSAGRVKVATQGRGGTAGWDDGDDGSSGHYGSAGQYGGGQYGGVQQYGGGQYGPGQGDYDDDQDGQHGGHQQGYSQGGREDQDYPGYGDYGQPGGYPRR